MRNEVLLMESKADLYKVVGCCYHELRTLVAFHMCSVQFVDLLAGLYRAYNSNMTAAEFQREGPMPPWPPVAGGWWRVAGPWTGATAGR